MNEAEEIGGEAIGQVPRILGMIDRDNPSSTYGCAERYFWHYKLHDFPNARFQEVSEVLACAFVYSHASNPYHGKEKIREWALAAVRYWERMRRGDGSFDEAYPWERSFCATAFSAMHATQALMLLKEPPVTDLAPVGRWLARHEADDTANQQAASAAALANLSILICSDALLRAARRRGERMREEHARLGYFNEYGGSDLGYASITLSALAIYAARARDESAGDWVKREADRLGSNLGADGVYEYGGQSRSTRFFYPFSLAWAGSGQIGKISRGAAQQKILQPSWMDDRYMVPYAADYLRSALWLSGGGTA